MIKILKKIFRPFQYVSLPVVNIGRPTSSIHQFEAKKINGQTVKLSTFKGKKLLIVNTASECGLTPQFKALEALFQRFKGENFMIIGFPSNDFGHQDPGSNEEISQFCEINFGVTFLMMEKISVRGKDIHPIYQWLTRKDKNGVMNSTVKWNFQKYLIDENGHLITFLNPFRKPDCSKIVNWIKN